MDAQSWRNLVTVFKNWRYTVLAAIIAFGFYAFNALLLNYRAVFSAFTTHGLGAFKLYGSFILGYKNAIIFHSFVTLVIISILFGILFSLILYKTIRFSEKKRLGFWSSIGIFLGVIAPGCAACGIGVFSPNRYCETPPDACSGCGLRVAEKRIANPVSRGNAER